MKLQIFVILLSLPGVNPLSDVLICDASAQVDENILKAAYIEHITRFIEWPRPKLSESDKYFIIGIISNNEFTDILKKIYSYQTIKKRNIKIVVITGPEEINQCHLCYFSGLSASLLKEYVMQANKAGVLTISDTSGYAHQGVHINFFSKENKLRFEINEKSMREAGFKMSYLLMNSAVII